jgi:peptidoglycan/LPS O-acetylase OafA/YrhL
MTAAGSAAEDPTWSVRRRYFPAVEGMRGVAALCVLGGHLLLTGYPSGERHVLGEWIAPFGVVIFFGISGFLLYRQFLAARHAGESIGQLTPAYLWRRAVRIFPAYWVALTLGTLWVGWWGAFTGHWWVFYGMLQNYSTAWLPDGLPVAWSLGIELSFYLALPLVGLLLAKRGLGSGSRDALRWEFGTLGGLALLALAWNSAMAGGAGNLNTNLLGTFAWFALGMMLAAIQVAHPASLSGLRRRLASPGLCWPASAAIFCSLVLGISRGAWLPVQGAGLLQTVAYGLASGLLLAPAVFSDSSRIVRLVLCGPAIVFIGTVSYGIYLWHFTVLAWLDQSTIVLTAKYPELTLGALVSSVSLALATASWYLIEKPLMRRAHSVKAFRRVRRGTIEVARDESTTPGPVGGSPAPLPEPAPRVSG